MHRFSAKNLNFWDGAYDIFCVYYFFLFFPYKIARISTGEGFIFFLQISEKRKKKIISEYAFIKVDSNR